VAGGTGAFRAVRIDSADTTVGPGGWIQFTALKHLDRCAMTLPATIHCSGRVTAREAFGNEFTITFNDFCEEVVKRAKDASRFCVMPGLFLSWQATHCLVSGEKSFGGDLTAV
jgi:hypothetical protein